jgi:hypothetical protein
MRSYAAAYKMCGDVCSAESQRDGPIARPVLAHALPDYRNQLYGTRSGSASGGGGE